MADEKTKGFEAEGDYFGVCPRCGKSDGNLNIGRSHWMRCDEHKLTWCVGSNLFSSWKDETEEQHQANEERLKDYVIIEAYEAHWFWDEEKALHELTHAATSYADALANKDFDFMGHQEEVLRAARIYWRATQGPGFEPWGPFVDDEKYLGYRAYQEDKAAEFKSSCEAQERFGREHDGLFDDDDPFGDNEILDDNRLRYGKNGEAYNGFYVGTSNPKELERVAKRTGGGGPCGATAGQIHALEHIRRDEDALRVLQEVKDTARGLMAKTGDDMSMVFSSTIDESSDALKEEDWTKFHILSLGAFKYLNQTGEELKLGPLHNESASEGKETADEKALSVSLMLLDAVTHYVKSLRFKDFNQTPGAPHLEIVAS